MYAPEPIDRLSRLSPEHAGASLGLAGARPSIRQAGLVGWIGLLVMFWGSPLAAQTSAGGASTGTNSSSTAAVDPVDEKQSFESSRKAFQDFNYATSERFFADFVRRFPQSDRVPEAVLFRARSLIEQAKLDDVVALLESELKNSGKVADEFRHWMGEALFRKGDFKNAATQFRALLENHPTSARRLEASYGEARAYFKLGDWKRTAELLKSPTESFQTAARAHVSAMHANRECFGITAGPRAS